MISDAELDNRFTYHKPIGNQPQRYEALRGKAKELARMMVAYVPASGERDQAKQPRRLTSHLRIAHSCTERQALLDQRRCPIELFIPCHRVVHAGGTIGGYGRHEDRKRWLRRHEGAI